MKKGRDCSQPTTLPLQAVKTACAGQVGDSWLLWGPSGQMVIQPWEEGSSNTPSPLPSKDRGTEGCRAPPEKLALD